MNSSLGGKETGVRPEVVSRLAPSAAKSAGGQPTKQEMAAVRRYNLAVWRVVNGKGSMTEEISVLTGLSAVSIARRCRRAEKHSTEAERNCEVGVFTHDERKYLLKMYAKSKDPAVKSFVQNVCHVERN